MPSGSRQNPADFILNNSQTPLWERPAIKVTDSNCHSLFYQAINLFIHKHLEETVISNQDR